MTSTITIGVANIASPISVGVLTPASPIEVGVVDQPITVQNTSIIGVESERGLLSVGVDEKATPLSLVVDTTQPVIEIGSAIQLGEVTIGASYTGARGVAGMDGKSAYQLWLDAGNVGSVYDFLLSIKGAQGEKGDKGETVIYRVTKEGFLEVWDELEGDVLDPTRINLEQLIIRINNGSTTINASKVSIGAMGLDVAFSSLENELDSVEARTTIAESQILQNANEITLKVSQTTFETAVAQLEDTVPYKVDIISTRGLVFRPEDTNTTLIARVYRGVEDVTDTIDANYFHWTRVSNDSESDTAWNTAHFGGVKQITITTEDVLQKATFFCEVDTTNI